MPTETQRELLQSCQEHLNKIQTNTLNAQGIQTLVQIKDKLEKLAKTENFGENVEIEENGATIRITGAEMPNTRRGTNGEYLPDNSTPSMQMQHELECLENSQHCEFDNAD